MMFWPILLLALADDVTSQAEVQQRNPAPIAAPTVETCDAGRIGSSELVGAVLFDESGSDLTSAARTSLNAMGSALSSRHPAQVLLVGHTDEAGSVTANERLAGARAVAVGRTLAPLLTDTTIVAMQCGETAPVLPKTVSGHAHNRRVEIRLLL